MFNDDGIEYDYKRILEDSDDLYEDDMEFDDDEYDYDSTNTIQYDCYYHTIANELID